MSELSRELLSGVIGSILGGLIVYFASTTFRLSKEARKKAKDKFEMEIALWKTRKYTLRQALSNHYLFEVLKYFLFASAIAMVPGIGTYAVYVAENEYAVIKKLYPLFALFTVASLVLYLIALGNALRYLRLRKSDEQDFLFSDEDIKAETSKEFGVGPR